MVDAIVVGAGPAGAAAALVLARAGARVVIVDRGTVPRDMLCGDLLTPHALKALGALGLDPETLPGVCALRGWRVGLPHARARDVVAPAGVAGPVAVRRRVLDAWLLDAAIRAGARFEGGWHVRRPLVDELTRVVRGVVMRRRGVSREVRLPAHLVIGADGRRSSLARCCGLRSLARAPQQIHQAYATGIEGLSDLSEIHIGVRAYCGMTPVGDGLVNVWGVSRQSRARRPPASIESLLAGLPSTRGRLGRMQCVTPLRLSTAREGDPRAVGVPGLLLAGDAAGWVDPAGGDGVSLALVGGQLAGDEVLRTLESGDVQGAVDRLAAARHARMGAMVSAARASRWGLRRGWAVHAAGVASHLAALPIDRFVLHRPFT